MSVVTYNLRRDRDPSGVSGTGEAVATIVEFESGLVAMHWNSDTPSVTVHTDVRHIEQINGHGGDSVLVVADTRLEAAYGRVVPWLCSARYHDRPTVCAPHPDHPDRLRLIFVGERPWRFWIALLDGSSDASSHVEVDGEMRHTWITPDGGVWLIWHSPLADESTDPPWSALEQPDDNPLKNFHEEDR